MGRPRRTSNNAPSPQTATTAPKAAPAAPQSSVSSRAAPASGRTASAPAAKSEGGRGGQSATSSRRAGQSSQAKSTQAYANAQGGTASSYGTRAKGPTAAVTSATAAPKSRGKASSLPSPLSAEEVVKIESGTRGQRTNPEWHKQREARITASVAPKIANSKFANGRSSEVPQSYLKAVVGSGSSVVTPAMSWGIKNEKKAMEAYETIKTSKTHKAVEIDGCGLFVDKKNSWLAASPDGIVKDAGTGKPLGVVEVKCPYKHRNRTVTEACKDTTFCLDKEGDSYELKKSHPYYGQVQCQMGVTGLKKADLVVHTNKETAVVPVDFDPAFWKSTVPKLEKFYADAVVPHLQEKQSATAWAPEE